MYRILLLVTLFVLLFSTTVPAQHIEILQQDKPTSIRGLSVVNNNVAWVSGSKGYVANTKDGGKTWNWQQVKGFEKSDFRDVEAFSEKEAIIMSSGTPALLLKTVDAGNSWKISYRNTDTAYFLDAMDFENHKHGFVMGDPINGRFIMMETKDGGDTWVKYNGPDAVKNQAAYAASGTCLLLDKSPVIVTGGSIAEIKRIENGKWVGTAMPLLQKESVKGAFSITKSKNTLVVVGGDYQNNKRQDSTACYSTDGGLKWLLPETFPAGYQSCVTYIDKNTLLSTGTSGSNISLNGGKNWIKIDNASYNVCRKAKHGNLILLAGDKGKIGILNYRIL